MAGQRGFFAAALLLELLRGCASRAVAPAGKLVNRWISAAAAAAVALAAPACLPNNISYGNKYLKSATHSDQIELVLRFLCAVAVVLNFSFLLDQELLQLVVLVRSLVIVHGVVSRPCRRAGDYGVRHRLSAGGRKQETDGTTTTHGLRPTNAQFSSFLLLLP